jgi:hypothetical protein
MLVGEIGLAYIAGFFDGEGCVRAYTRPDRFTGCHSRIQIAQSGERGRIVLQEISRFLLTHGVISQVHVHKYKNPKYLYGWYLQISRIECVKQFIRLVMPYLLVKKVEAQDTLRFLSMFGAVGRKSAALRRVLQDAWNRPGARENRLRGTYVGWEKRHARG